jgi:hypothetical protein
MINSQERWNEETQIENSTKEHKTKAATITCKMESIQENRKRLPNLMYEVKNAAR